MDTFAPALEHGQLQEVLPGIFFVTGAMKTMLMGAHWHFSRNMTVVRQGDELTLINTVRLNSAGLAQLDALGRVTHVMKIGSLHGRDDAFYVDRYGATFWALPGTAHEGGLQPQRELVEGGPLPIDGASLFAFHTTKLPEGIVRLDTAGGVLIACDALQNWVRHDEFFSDESRQTMTSMNFFQPANCGPLWMQVTEPRAEDFARLIQLDFRHVLCGHGEPLLDTAQPAFVARFQSLIGV